MGDHSDAEVDAVLKKPSKISGVETRGLRYKLPRQKEKKKKSFLLTIQQRRVLNIRGGQSRFFLARVR